MDEQTHIIWKIRDRTIAWKLLQTVMTLLVRGCVDLKISGGRFFFDHIEAKNGEDVSYLIAKNALSTENGRGKIVDTVPVHDGLKEET